MNAPLITGFDGHVCVVTGGTSGIGASVVERFVEAGASVVFCGRNAEAGGELAARLGDRAAYVQADVAVASDIERVIEHAVERFGGLNSVVSNAGSGGIERPIVEASEEDFDRSITVNLKSHWWTIKFAAPHLIAAGGGSIICTSASVSTNVALPRQGAYSAAKGGLVQMARVAALELARSFVRVNCITPGAILTPLVAPKGPNERILETMKGLQPMPRIGMPVDIANAALWLASDLASFVTGQVIHVDGGMISELHSKFRDAKW